MHTHFFLFLQFHPNIFAIAGDTDMSSQAMHVLHRLLHADNRMLDKMPAKMLLLFAGLLRFVHTLLPRLLFWCYQSYFFQVSAKALHQNLLQDGNSKMLLRSKLRLEFVSAY